MVNGDIFTISLNLIKVGEKMKTKKRITVFLILALVLSITLGLTGCGNSTSGASPASTAPSPTSSTTAPSVEPAATTAAATVAVKKTPADTFVYGLDFAGSSFDPANSIAGWLTPIWMTYENLVIYNAATGTTEPMLAKSWSWTDATTIVFQLRDDVTFSDGTKFTGDDVLFSWQRMLKSMMWAAQAKNIDFENCKVEGSTLTIKLMTPNSEFLDTLSAVGYAIVSKAYVEKNGEDFFKLNPMGTGPYKQDVFTAGESISYVANDTYWGGTPVYKNVIIKLMIDEATRTVSFEAGELDAARFTTSDSINTLINRDAEGITVGSVNSGFTYYVNLGDFNEYFKDQNLRLAFAHAIDWDALVQAIWGDYGTLQKSCLPDFSSYYKSVGSYEYNAELAKKYLADGGYADGYIIKMAVGNSGNDQAIAEIMQSYLAEVGIRLVLTVTDNAMARQLSSSGESDISIGQGNGYNGNATMAIIGKIAGSNSLLQEIHTDSETGITFQKYIVDLMAEQDAAKKKAIAEEMQQFVYDQCLWVPVCQVKFTVASWNYFEGMNEELQTYGTNTGLDLRGLLVKK